MFTPLTGIRGVVRRDVLSGVTIDSDTVVGITMNGLGLRPSESIVGARVLLEITANTETSNVDLNYYGPIILDNGSYLNPDVSEHTVVTVPSSSADNRSCTLSC